MQTRQTKPVSIKYRLRTADYGLRTGYKTWTRYKMRTGKYGLGIKHGLGTKRGLRTVDCGLWTGYKIWTTDYGGKTGSNQARIHTGFHRFAEIGKVFHNKYIFSKKSFKISKLKS